MHPRGGDQAHPGRFSAGHGSAAPKHSDEAAEHGHEAIKYEASNPGPRTMQDLIGMTEKQDPADLARANKEAMEEIGKISGAKWDEEDASDEDLAHLFGGKTPSTKIKGSFVETAKQKKKREAFIASFGPSYEAERAKKMVAYRTEEERLTKEGARVTVRTENARKLFEAKFPGPWPNRAGPNLRAAVEADPELKELKESIEAEIKQHTDDSLAFEGTQLALTHEHMDTLMAFCLQEAIEVNQKYGISAEAFNKKRLKFGNEALQFPKFSDPQVAMVFGGQTKRMNTDRNAMDLSRFQDNRVRAMEFLRDSVNMALYADALTIPLLPLKAGERAGAIGGHNEPIDGLLLSLVNPVQTFVHESGHVLEKSCREGEKRALNFLKRRGIATSAFGSGEKQVSLQSTLSSSYSDHETGAKDEFDKVWAALGFSPRGSAVGGYYTGKIYPDKSTETMSMGMEMLVEAPKEFASVDPQYFHYVIDGMSGRGLPKTMKLKAKESGS